MAFIAIPLMSQTNGRVKSPNILSDNRVEFHVMAPQANKVQIDLGKTYDMQKDDRGMWSVTTEPQGPGFHYYNLIIDGVSVADPSSESFYGCGRMTSGIEIPYASDVKQYEVQDVPHGDVRALRYFSKVTNSWRKMFVYTPPGYENNIKQKYPVLYIMHGGGEDARGWVEQGRTDIIIDNLIAAKKALPMLIVCLDANVGGYPNVQKEIINNIIPFVESKFRVDAKPSKRALAGLSMGGLNTLYVGIPNNDIFNYLGVFSSGWFASGGMGAGNEAEESYAYIKNNIGKFNSNMKLFWISEGGREDIAYNNGQTMIKRLKELNVKYTYYESKGGGHTWPVWREDLFLFAPKLFK